MNETRSARGPQRSVLVASMTLGQRCVLKDIGQRIDERDERCKKTLKLTGSDAESDDSVLEACVDSIEEDMRDPKTNWVRRRV